MTVIVNDTRPVLSPDHVGVHRGWTRFATNEEIHAAMDTALWLVTTDEDSNYPLDVSENTRLNQQALITACEAELAYRTDRGVFRAPVSIGIPREYLDDLKSRVRVEEEIGLAIPLRQHGSTFKGLCPFHDERTPSLIVWSNSQRLHCFGCNVGGDVYTWVQAWMPTDFRGSVVYLAARAGLPLPEEQRASARPGTFQFRRRLGATS